MATAADPVVRVLCSPCALLRRELPSGLAIACSLASVWLKWTAERLHTVLDRGTSGGVQKPAPHSGATATRSSADAYRVFRETVLVRLYATIKKRMCCIQLNPQRLVCLLNQHLFICLYL